MEKIKRSGAKPAIGSTIAWLRETDVLIYGLKNCDSCRKAKKALPEA
ncbi:MAG TPA: arsenate reductase, partial [Sulfitobacter sp.]|nr:arsenate reductase [Sulfitobacter sp.]